MTCQHPPEHTITSGFETVWVMIGPHAHQRYARDEQGKCLEIRYCGKCHSNVRRDGSSVRAHVERNAPEGVTA